MHSTPDTQAVEKELKSIFDQSPDIVAVYLYGSVARGDARPASDIDIGVPFSGDQGKGLQSLRLNLEGLIEQTLSKKFKREVQMVVLNGASADLIHRVLRDGVTIFERDKSARIAFEVRSRNEYFELYTFTFQATKRGSTAIPKISPIKSWRCDPGSCACLYGDATNFGLGR